MCSCNRDTIFDEERSFSNDTWNRFQNETFEVSANNVDDFYDFYITVTIDTAQYIYRTLPLNINLYSPNGERRMFQGTVTLRTPDGRLKGTTEGTLLTTTKKVRDCYCFNVKGSHRIEIGQATNYYDIHGVKSIRMNITKTKLEYPE